MLKLTIRVLALAVAIAFLWISPAHADADLATTDWCEQNYEQCLTAWKEERLAFLKSENGFLNLAGLYWLKDGNNTFGSGANNDLVFPASAAASIGVFELRDGEVRLDVAPDLDVSYLGNPVQRLLMTGAPPQEPIIVRHGSYAWNVINRDEKYAVRLRDFENPVLLDFPAIDYFPTNHANRVTATLHRYETPRVVRVGTVIEGLNYNPWSPGVVEFEIDGQTVDLEAYDAGDRLFFVFGDRTTGRETYPAGRFLYADKPGADGIVELDFNRAHSPPCAYNDFATCPVASPRNRIAVRIAAGERYDRTHH